MVKPRTIIESMTKAGSDAKKYPLVFLNNNYGLESNDLPLSVPMIETGILVEF